jgi:hypothetical protein
MANWKKIKKLGVYLPLTALTITTYIATHDFNQYAKRAPVLDRIEKGLYVTRELFEAQKSIRATDPLLVSTDDCENTRRRIQEIIDMYKDELRNIRKKQILWKMRDIDKI